MLYYKSICFHILYILANFIDNLNLYHYLIELEIKIIYTKNNERKMLLEREIFIKKIKRLSSIQFF